MRSRTSHRQERKYQRRVRSWRHRRCNEQRSRRIYRLLLSRRRHDDNSHQIRKQRFRRRQIRHGNWRSRGLHRGVRNKASHHDVQRREHICRHDRRRRSHNQSGNHRGVHRKYRRYCRRHGRRRKLCVGFDSRSVGHDKRQ